MVLSVFSVFDFGNSNCRQAGIIIDAHHDSEQYEAFKMRECRYNPIFNDFLNDKFGMNELMKRIAEADENEIDDSAIVYQVQMVDLESKEGKTVKLIALD